MDPASFRSAVAALDDAAFDAAYPLAIRCMSRVHWTPVRVATHAARFLVHDSSTRVLDIGCGPAKFCIVGAIATCGQFTGIERRQHLHDLARSTIADAALPNATVRLGNILELDFSDFDAFYLFNPFAENIDPEIRIDDTVPLSPRDYDAYAAHVATQLALAPVGTRLATYCGDCEEVPRGYECIERASAYDLRLWQKTHAPAWGHGSPRL